MMNTKIEWAINQTATGRQLGAYKSAAAKVGLTLDEWLKKCLSGNRWCYHCRGWKAVAEFAVDKSRLGGKSSVCRPCNSERSKRSRYGLTREDRARMETKHCPICDRAEQIMVIDHDHHTGAVRGLLCSRCNVGLGLFCDDPDLLGRAVAYLEGHRG